MMIPECWSSPGPIKLQFHICVLRTTMVFLESNERNSCLSASCRIGVPGREVGEFSSESEISERKVKNALRNAETRRFLGLARLDKDLGCLLGMRFDEKKTSYVHNSPSVRFG